MFRQVVRLPFVVFLCAALMVVGCSRGPSSPTGFAVGIGTSAEALFDPEAYQPNPVELTRGKSSAAPDVHGTFSVEDFRGTQENLTFAHESAAGFREFLNNWNPQNFAYRDGGVGAWAFNDVVGGDNWDRWSFGGIDRGIDGPLVVFNSSHGSMDPDGLYSFSLGTDWAGRGWNATSDNMSLGGNAGGNGDERLRYIFWDSGNSVKWSGGITPWTTWGPRARGVRMIFGYDSETVDSPDYGRFFWEEWSKGKSLTYAFLDASWRVNHGQSPCVVAFGSDAEEAANRRDYERVMAWSAVGSNRGAWRYYYVSKSGGAGKTAQLDYGDIPSFVAVRDVSRRNNSDDGVREVAERIGIRLSDERMIQDRPFGLRAIHTADSTLVIEEDGDFELTLAREARPKAAGQLIDDRELVNKARQIVDQFGLAGDHHYRGETVRYLAENEASAEASAGQPMIVERTVVFDQVIDDIAFIDPDAGHVEVTFDAGTNEVLRIRSTLRQIVPSYEKAVFEARSKSLDEVRQIAVQTLSSPPVPDDRGGAKQFAQLQIVPSSEEVGYRMIDGKAIPVYRALLANPAYPSSKLQEAIVPLAMAE